MKTPHIVLGIFISLLAVYCGTGFYKLQKEYGRLL
jgi:hypothetical protein